MELRIFGLDLATGVIERLHNCSSIVNERVVVLCCENRKLFAAETSQLDSHTSLVSFNVLFGDFARVLLVKVWGLKHHVLRVLNSPGFFETLGFLLT